MQVSTESSIDISESLASFILAAHIHHNLNESAVFEKRLNNVKTGKYSIADVYIPTKSTAIEVKSVAHGSSALKGVVQASMYKEAVDEGVFFMQRPRRDSLKNTIKSMSDTLGVGVLFLESVPSLCDEDTIISATGGCSKPFELWKRDRYTRTKKNIIARSRTEWMGEYLEALEQIVCEHSDELFNFAVKPDSEVGGLSEVYR